LISGKFKAQDRKDGNSCSTNRIISKHETKHFFISANFHAEISN
jgi:hypothetical protein